MVVNGYAVAQLDQERLQKLRALEQETGKCIVALQKRYDLADLSDPALQKIRKAEQALGVVLLAYEEK